MTDAARQEVWLAMSDLFLDTDVDLRVDDIVRRLQAAPYDLPMLEQIFIEEVYPVCILNLSDVAGQWDGFPQDRLCHLIEDQRRGNARPGKLALWWRWRDIRRRVPAWFEVMAQLRALDGIQR